MWEAVETKAGKTRVVKAEGRRGKKRSGKKTRRKGGKKEKEIKIGKNDGSKESGRRMGDLG